MLNNLLATDTTINLLPKDARFTNVVTLTPGEVVRAIVLLVLVVAALVFFFMLLWGGLQWILSGGDKGKTEAARNQITAAMVGLVIVFAAWAILQLMSSFLGVDISNFNIPTLKGA
jgi:TRAP-type C4-dicarboxylate transport system permease small subunit